MKHSKENNFKNVLYATIIFILFALCLLFLFLFLFTSNTSKNILNEYNKSQEELAQIKSTPSSENDREQEQEQEKEKQQVENNPQDKVYTVGETYQDTMKVTFLNYNSNFKNFTNYYDLKSTEKVIRAEFEIENISEDYAPYISTSSFSCFANDYSARQLTMTEANLIYDSHFEETLSKGKKVKGAVYFSVPKTSTNIEIDYYLDPKTTIKFKAE